VRAWLRSCAAVFALALCFPLSACGGDTSFEHGVNGVRLSDRVGYAAAWSPDGKWIAVPARVGLRLRNVRSGKFRSLDAPAYQGFPERPGRLDWSADGKTIRYVTSLPKPTNGNASWLTETQVDGSGFRHTSLGVKALSVDWADGGWPLAYATGAYAYDIEKGPVGPKPSLYVVDAFGAAPRRVAYIPHPVGEEDITEPQVSPDGKRIAFLRWGRRHNVNVWTVGTDGSDAKPLVPSLVEAHTLSWSPDGRFLALGAFTLKGDRRQHVYVVPAGGGKLRTVVDQEILDGPLWTPDGQWLTYSTYAGEIHRVRPDGSADQVIGEVPNQEVHSLLWSPDGRHLAYTANDYPPRD
jgi:Tol biopolymer transport system component